MCYPTPSRANLTNASPLCNECRSRDKASEFALSKLLNRQADQLEGIKLHIEHVKVMLFNACRQASHQQLPNSSSCHGCTHEIMAQAEVPVATATSTGPPAPTSLHQRSRNRNRNRNNNCTWSPTCPGCVLRDNLFVEARTKYMNTHQVQMSQQQRTLDLLNQHLYALKHRV